MPDITMCTGEGCPRRQTCYRYRATPSEFRQAYFTTPPLETVGGLQVCEYYDHDEWKGRDVPVVEEK